MNDFEKECQKLDKAVDEFAEIMKAKLHLKVAQGYSGWNDKKHIQNIRTKLLEHSAKAFAGDNHQAVDVANLAMMLYYMELKQ